MKKLLPLLCVALIGLGVGLSGCEEAYAPSLRYPVTPGPDPHGPRRPACPRAARTERPGQLPLLTLADLNKPHNPLHPKRDEIESAEKLRDPTKILAGDRQKIEEGLQKMFGTPAQPMVRGYDREAKKVTDLFQGRAGDAQARGQDAGEGEPGLPHSLRPLPRRARRWPGADRPSGSTRTRATSGEPVQVPGGRSDQVGHGRGAAAPRRTCYGRSSSVWKAQRCRRSRC